MSTVEEIEKAIRGLPRDNQKELALKINDLFWEGWDDQIEKDAKAGKFGALITEIEEDIDSGNTEKLDEFLDNT